MEAGTTYVPADDEALRIIVGLVERAYRSEPEKAQLYARHLEALRAQMGRKVSLLFHFYSGHPDQAKLYLLGTPLDDVDADTLTLTYDPGTLLGTVKIRVPRSLVHQVHPYPIPRHPRSP